MSPVYNGVYTITNTIVMGIMPIGDEIAYIIGIFETLIYLIKVKLYFLYIRNSDSSQLQSGSGGVNHYRET